MAQKKKPTQPKKRDRLKPLSLHPLTPEKALSAFMRVKPKKGKKTTGLGQRKKQSEGGMIHETKTE